MTDTLKEQWYRGKVGNCLHTGEASLVAVKHQGDGVEKQYILSKAVIHASGHELIVGFHEIEFKADHNKTEKLYGIEGHPVTHVRVLSPW